jgi:hypothetical protein
MADVEQLLPILPTRGFRYAQDEAFGKKVFDPRKNRMRNPLRKVVHRLERPEARERATLRTLTILIPRTYNPDARGVRKRVELSKLVRTFRELRQLFSGYSVQPTAGWYRDENTGKGVRDRHFRFDIDLLVTRSVIETLRKWKNILEVRFQQQAIYMKLSEQAVWL